MNPKPQSYGQFHQGEVDLAALNRDIESLISKARADFASNPLEPSVQQRLKALLDLQNILQQQKLPQDQLKLIRDQVSQLKPALPPVIRPATTIPPVQPVSTPTPQPNLNALLNPNTLAGLLKATTNRQSQTPPPRIASTFLQPQAVASTPPPPPQPVAQAPSENPLIASLRARGLLPPVQSNSVPATPPNLPFILPGQTGVPNTVPISGSQTPNPVEFKINVQLNSTSIRM